MPPAEHYAKTQAISTSSTETLWAHRSGRTSTTLHKTSVTLQSLSIAAGLAALAALRLADLDGAISAWEILGWVAVIALVAGVAAGLRRLPDHVSYEIPILPVLVALFLGALVVETGIRVLFGFGQPFEWIVMRSLGWLALGMTATAVTVPRQRGVLGVGLFLLVFALTTHFLPDVQICGSLFLAASIGWLVVAHAELLPSQLSRQAKSRQPFPRWLGFALAIVFPLLCLVATGERHLAHGLSGWIPSSGGSGDYDPFSRGGIGDGDQLVAGTENIQSFGALDDAPFIPDHRPSLYDLFDDTYNEPVRNEKQDRAISIRQDPANRQVERHLAETQQAARQFSTARQSRTAEQKAVGSIPSHALLHVAGRVPLHLRLEVYDRFDGVNWTPEAEFESLPAPKIETVHGKPWLQVSPRHPREAEVAATETHALKIVSLDTARIPAPAGLRAVHVDQIDRADFFQPLPAGQIAFQRERLPELVPIHLVSELIDGRRVLERHRDRFSVTDNRLHRDYPVGELSREVRQLAFDWTKDAHDSHEQIEAIVHRLRSEYVLDNDAVPPAGVASPVLHFLATSRRGPDYQFATSAAVLLRTLGFSTRFVTGLYASPERCDARRRHTEVLPSDVHAWVEVYVGEGQWLTIEPTPGYEVLGPPPTFLGWIGASMLAIGKAMLEAWYLVLLAVAIGAIAIRLRRSLAMRFRQTWWMIVPPKTAAEAIRRTLVLVDWRARRVGLQRRPGETPTQWLVRIQQGLDSGVEGLDPRQLAIMQRALYAPTAKLNSVDDDVRAVCQAIARYRFARVGRTTRENLSSKGLLPVAIVSGNRRMAT